MVFRLFCPLRITLFADARSNTLDNDVIVNLGSPDDQLSEEVNLSWQDVNVYADIKKGSWISCLKSCGKQGTEKETLHILKNGELI